MRRPPARQGLAAGLLTLLLAATGAQPLPGPEPHRTEAPAATATTPAKPWREALSQPLPGLADDPDDPGALRRFEDGRALFRQSWVVAPSQDGRLDGLGPLYNRLACISCHAKNGRGGAPEGPGQRMQSMLMRLSVPGRDAHGGPRPHPVYGDQLNEEGIEGVPGEGRAEVEWLTRTLRLADGTRLALRRPRWRLTELAYGPLPAPGGPALQLSPRVSPAVAGLGLLETVPDSALLAYARQPKPDGVRGRVNRVWDVTAQRTVIGRFGLKANSPSLRQQIAAAFHGDMGLTSPLFPREGCQPAQTACRQAPSGGEPEVDAAQLDQVEFYLAQLAPPPRRDAQRPEVQRGEALFARLGCALCHRPTLPGAPHPRFPRLGGPPVAAYTDLLLHDMGPALADGRPDHQANGSEWRTAPLWGLGLMQALNEQAGWLHDGRARSPEEAIAWHGGEAARARQRYLRLPAAQRAELLAFLRSL